MLPHSFPDVAISGSRLLQIFHMAARHGPSCWCRVCVIDLRRSLRDEHDSFEEPLVDRVIVAP